MHCPPMDSTLAPPWPSWFGSSVALAVTTHVFCFVPFTCPRPNRPANQQARTLYSLSAIVPVI